MIHHSFIAFLNASDSALLGGYDCKVWIGHWMINKSGSSNDHIATCLSLQQSQEALTSVPGTMKNQTPMILGLGVRTRKSGFH